MHGEKNIPTETLTDLGSDETNINFAISRRSLLGLPERSFGLPDRRDSFVLNWKKRIALGTAAGLLLTGLSDGALGSGSESGCTDTDISCELAAAQIAVPQTMRLGPITEELTTTTTTGTIPPETTIVPETTTTVLPPPKTVPVTVAAEYHNPERIGVAPETAAALEGMNLTAEGYQNFFNRIDHSWYDYAQQFLEFNPEAVSNPANYPPGRESDAIPQSPTQWITAHYTVSYYNEQPGHNHEPVGETSHVNRAIDFQATERGVPCCGFNFLIDRNGGIYQLAPYWAKLRHNPPFDGITTGFEIEAYLQEQITSAQYETATYLTIAMLQNEGLLGTKSLYDLLHGHGDDRDTYREAHPEDGRWDQRNDFDRALMEIWIPRIEAFLAANPDIAALTQTLR